MTIDDMLVSSASKQKVYCVWIVLCGFVELSTIDTGPHVKTRPSKNPLSGAPMLKGVVLKTLIRKPKKPNSANRKCVLVRLSNGKEMVAYIPGEGHNLQEHNIVLVRVGRVQDLPGVKLKCIRGKHDLGHVVKKK
nr:EOG090X0NTZ [Ilyocryptus agilis]